MKVTSLAVVSLIGLSGCVAPPSSPMEAAARKAAAAEFVVRNCAGHVGGYQSVRTMREDANKNMVNARNLGATDGVIQKAQTDVQTMFNTTAAFTTKQDACNSLVGELAWAGG